MFRTSIIQNFKRSFTTLHKGIKDNLMIQKLTNVPKLQPKELYDRFTSQDPSDIKSSIRTHEIIDEIGSYVKLSREVAQLDASTQENKTRKDDMWRILHNLLEKYDEVISLCNKSIKHKPDFLPAYYMKATLLQNRNSKSEALAVLDQFLKDNPDSWKAYRSKAKIYADDQQGIKAIMYLEKACSIEKNSVEMLFELAEAYEKIKLWKQARQCFDKIIALSPEETGAYLLKGKVLKELNQHSQVIDCCDKLIAKDPKNVEAYFLKAESLEQLDRKEEALQYYNKVTEVDPKQKEAWKKKEFILWRFERYEEMLRCWERIIELNPGNVFPEIVAKTRKAIYRKNQGEISEAIEICSDIIRIHNENHWEPKYQVLHIFNTWNDAIEICDQVLANQPESVAAQSVKKYCLQEKDKALKRIEYADQTLESKPEDISFASLKANSLYETKQLEDALKSLEKYFELQPDKEENSTTQDKFTKTAGRYDEAMNNFLKINLMSPDFYEEYGIGTWFDCKETLQYYNKLIEVNQNNYEAHAKKALVLQQLEKFDDSLKACETAIKLNPTYSDAYLIKATILYRRKNYNETIAHCDQAIKLQPANAGAENLKAACFAKLQRYEESLEHFNKAVELDPFYGHFEEIKREVLFRLKKWNEVIDCCDRLLVRKKSAPGEKLDNYYFCKGRSFEMLGDYDSAIKSYNKISHNNFYRLSSNPATPKEASKEALENGVPNNANACFYEGLIMYALGQPGVAETCFDNAICYCPDFAEAYKMRGMCRGRLGYSDGGEDLEVAEFLNPEEKREQKLILDLGNLTPQLEKIKELSEHKLIEFLKIEKHDGEDFWDFY